MLGGTEDITLKSSPLILDDRPVAVLCTTEQLAATIIFLMIRKLVLRANDVAPRAKAFRASAEILRIAANVPRTSAKNLRTHANALRSHAKNVRASNNDIV